MQLHADIVAKVDKYIDRLIKNIDRGIVPGVHPSHLYDIVQIVTTSPQWSEPQTGQMIAQIVEWADERIKATLAATN